MNEKDIALKNFPDIIEQWADEVRAASKALDHIQKKVRLKDYEPEDRFVVYGATQMLSGRIEELKDLEKFNKQITNEFDAHVKKNEAKKKI